MDLGIFLGALCATGNCNSLGMSETILRIRNSGYDVSGIKCLGKNEPKEHKKIHPCLSIRYSLNEYKRFNYENSKMCRVW